MASYTGTADSASPSPGRADGAACIGEASVSASGATVDIGSILDDGAFTGVQGVVVLLAALSILVDGFDGQLIGYVIPVLIKEWGITRNAFAPVVAAGLAGMAFGSIGAGLVADRLGRRWAIIGSVLLFGVATFSIGFAPNIWMIALLRFIAGLGIGGVLPTSTTLTAEYTPARFRTMAVTVTIVCVPLGGMLAGVLAAHVLPVYGWRGLFMIGGTVTFALALALCAGLRESPRFLARRTHRWPELARLLRAISRPVEADATFVDAREQGHEKHAGFTALFKDQRANDTIAIWIANFMGLLAVYSAFSWLPAMLTGQGLPVAISGRGLMAYNLGGVIGALVCAVAISRFGSRWPLVVCSVGGALSAWALIGVDPLRSANLLVLGLGLHGLFVNAVISTSFALCAYVYPTKVRATGTAAANSFGRMGAILSSFAGAAVITMGGASSYLWMLGAAMAAVTVALALVRRHIPRPGRQ
ncbi:MFS transporter [Paraburkholderia susongensis]|uniref:MFS transporter, AAHS family, 4-hydroxybenzoate transporter n=1 Tax=Paraburkholderia susongensis TaxID=1515439 RepID=A0A1X7HZD4_9BURK|nr:MFS transporter [Paraburkholderia susongensis]SMG06695.1 MFS transporter, AAHS family, 4-hydroxybenzoate transporter [Paraburkholderia susongensis]